MIQRFSLLVNLVQVGFDFGFRQSIRRATIFRNFDVGGPENGVEHDFAKIVVSPTVVIVRAGETESASTAWSLIRPCDMLPFTGCDGFANGWVSAASAILAAQRFRSR